MDDFLLILLSNAPLGFASVALTIDFILYKKHKFFCKNIIGFLFVERNFRLFSVLLILVMSVGGFISMVSALIFFIKDKDYLSGTISTVISLFLIFLMPYIIFNGLINLLYNLIGNKNKISSGSSSCSSVAGENDQGGEVVFYDKIHFTLILMAFLGVLCESILKIFYH